jgi:hypothetical protein
MSATVAAMTPAIIGVAGGLAAVLLAALLTWRKTLRDREHRARVVARRLIPDVDELRLKLNEALRTNQPGTLTPEQAILETWTAGAQEAIAGSTSPNHHFDRARGSDPERPLALSSARRARTLCAVSSAQPKPWEPFLPASVARFFRQSPGGGRVVS